MFDLGNLEQLPATLPTPQDLAAQPLPHDPAQIIDQLTTLEDTINALRAHQTRLAVALAEIRAAESPSRRRDDGMEQGREEELARMRRARISVGAEIALARRISPHAGARFLSLAKVLHTELPHTLAAFEAGHLNEHRAELIVAGTACLSLEHRQVIDAAVAADPHAARTWGDRALRAAVRTHAAELDPHGVVEQIRRAEGERRVTLRPGHDHMTHLHAVLPIREGVACLAALKTAATHAISTGGATSHSQAMADALVTRLTSREATESETASQVPQVPAVPAVQLRLVMTAESLLGADDTPAALTDGVDHTTWIEAIPAPLARAWVHHDLITDQQVLVKRLFTAPGTRDLIATESRARCFPPALADLIALRDRWCRTPYCNAPIRHLDHITPHARGGPTSLLDGQGLCEQCNHTKEAPGWTHVPPERPGQPLRITTPTGHHHTARDPVP